MKSAPHIAASALIASAVLIAVLVIWWRFEQDMKLARFSAAQGSLMAATPCGPIEYQEAGSGVPLLTIHGSGGGHDQGMGFAAGLARHGVRVIAMSRFGYLRTPMPADASPAAQADAHVCLLNALKISRAAVLGGSAGAPSAMQLAIRHPDRVSALILLAPLAWKPATTADSPPPLAPWVEGIVMRLIRSDFLFWVGHHLANDQMTRWVLATPPERVAAASPQERARIDTMLAHILPVSARADGLRSDTLLGKSLTRYPLESIHAATLIISARDDGYGTFASAQYLAGELPGSTFIALDDGGHTWVGHDVAVQAAILKLVIAQGST